MNLKKHLKIIYFKLSGSRPWSRGYFTYKNTIIAKFIRHSKLIRLFAVDQKLPANYGYGLDERIVEYPWVLNQLQSLPPESKLLDAGSTLNFDFIVTHPILKNIKLTVATLAPEPGIDYFCASAVSYNFTDIRELPYQNDWFDAVACVSTLEHIGMDNGLYTSDKDYAEAKTADFLTAVSELRRVLKPGGLLLITVPFGRYHNYGFFQQFDQQMLLSILNQDGIQETAIDYFAYTEHGWIRTTAADCASADYYDIRNTASPHPFKQASAGAVACLTIKNKI